MPDFSIEIAAGRKRGRIICGVDEAGRGPLAGPVLACAVILPLDTPRKLLRKLDDSKKLQPEVREELALELRERAIFALGEASVEEIDSINILQASLLAMRRAVSQLSTRPELALIDGNKSPSVACETQAIVQGDERCWSISAASILAKVARDKIMRDLALTHSTYGWERNVGYGTPEHLEAISQHGICVHHRRSFRPIYESLPVID